MLEISSTNSNQRIDKFLFKQLAQLPHSVIHKLIRTGQVRINSGRVSSGYLLRPGDKLRLPPKHIITNLNIKFGSEQFKSSRSRSAATRSISLEDSEKFLKKNSVFNDDEIIIINKPYGLASQGGSSINISLDDYLLDEYRLVHRIDKQTSGLLIIAKHYQAARKFTNLFKLNKIFKLYLAVVYSRSISNSGSIDNEDGRSDYRILDSNNNLHLIAVFPITGKKHQIRKHMQAILATIVGDTKYNLSLISNRDALLSKISKVQKNYKKIDKLYSYFEKISRQSQLKLHATCLAFSDPYLFDERTFIENSQNCEIRKNNNSHSNLRIYYARPNSTFMDFINQNNLNLPSSKNLKSMIHERIDLRKR